MANKGPSKAKGNTGSIWWVIGVAVIGAAVLIGILVMSANKLDPVAQGGVKTDPELGAAGTSRGKATAKVDVVEYGDYL